jgi:competence protein ComEC
MSDRGPGPGRTPALGVAAALAAGIWLDRRCEPVLAAWSAGLVGALLAAFFLERRRAPRVAAGSLIAAVACLGGLRHHAAWSLRGPNDISRFAREEPQPVRLTGMIVEPVTIRAADDNAFTPEWMRADRSLCEISAEQVIENDVPVPVSGRVRLEVSGHLLHATVGDWIDVVGHLARPGPPRNPGAFDFRAYLRARGIDCLVRCENPDAVQRLAPRPQGLPSALTHALARGRHALRAECDWMLQQHLSPRTYPVATSLLLGGYTQMPDEIRTAFAQSGTMHLLAISGLHVGILAGLMYGLCRLLNTSSGGTALIVLGTILAYAFITDHRPPVLRATVLACVVVAALPWARRASGMNTLAVSAIVVLLWRPTDLFDVGAQLSFLAVMGIIWVSQWTSGRWQVLFRRRPSGLEPEPGTISRWARPVVRWLGDAHLLTGSIWLLTLPLTLAVFHLASPIGFVVNVVLVPYSALVLACGFALLVVGLLAPWAAAVPGVAFDLTLRGMLNIVEWSAGTPWGHLYLPGPPGWWIIGWYSLLAVATGCVRAPVSRAWRWRALALWTIGGLACGLRPPARDGLRCTFLAVGHGAAIALELPHGRTLLYDAGTLADGQRAQRAVQEALWLRGISRIDAVIVSHADIDHFNGVTGLLQTMPVEQLFIAQSLLDFDQPAVAELCETASAHGATIRLLHTGDRLRADPAVELDVLHPPPGSGDPLDNANSLALRVRYARRTILLTGDLEGPGLSTLLDFPREHVDVLQSPHHGSRAANPPQLAAWARPEFTIVSTGHRGLVEPLRRVYGDQCRVLSTAESGAVTVEISPAGDLLVSEYLQPAAE